MASESIAHLAFGLSWAIDSEPIRARGIIVNYYSTDVTVIWAGGRTEPPLDKPRCGWENELCLEQERQGKFLGKIFVYFLGCILCISVESGTTAVRQRITLIYSFHWSCGQTSDAFSFDLKIWFKVNFKYLKTNSNLQSEQKYIDLLGISFCSSCLT